MLTSLAHIISLCLRPRFNGKSNKGLLSFTVLSLVAMMRSMEISIELTWLQTEVS